MLSQEEKEYLRTTLRNAILSLNANDYKFCKKCVKEFIRTTDKIADFND